MIEAVRWRPFVRWFTGQSTKRIRSAFDGVYVHGLQRLQLAARDTPLLVIANHSSWWDALIALWVSETKLEGIQAYGMMESSNLRRLRFFRWLGVFGVDRTSRRDGARVTRYALELLRQRGNVVWMFPQGEEQPPHVPLEFQSGAAGIAKRATAIRVVPVAFAYVFEGSERPNVYISIGEPMDFEAGTDRHAQARAVDQERQRIARQLESRAEGFETVISTRRPRRGLWATALLDRFAGWLAPRQEKARAALPPDSRLDGAQTPTRAEP